MTYNDVQILYKISLVICVLFYLSLQAFIYLAISNRKERKNQRIMDLHVNFFYE